MATGDKIYIADKPTLDSVNTKVGTNADVAGTTTVFARLKQIYDYLAGTILTAINGRQASWGAVAGTKTNIDNTATKVATNETNINSINTKVGVSTDTGTTTLFGVIKNNGGLNLNKPLQITGTNSTHYTGLVVDVTGVGYLLAFLPNITGTGGNFSVQIDNGKIFRIHFVGTSGINGRISTPLRFTSSLKIYKDTSLGGNGEVIYILD